jgi:hypothetical protein
MVWKDIFIIKQNGSYVLNGGDSLKYWVNGKLGGMHLSWLGLVTRRGKVVYVALMQQKSQNDFPYCFILTFGLFFGSKHFFWDWDAQFGLWIQFENANDIISKQSIWASSIDFLFYKIYQILVEVVKTYHVSDFLKFF